MTQFFKTQCDRPGALHNGKLDVIVSIRAPGDKCRDEHDACHGHHDCHPHLPDTGVVAGEYGSATESAQFTVDSKGRLTTAGATLITPAWGSITDKPSTLDGYGITDALPVEATAVAAGQLATAHEIAATGDADWSVTFDGSADVSAPLTLVDTGVNAGDYGSATESAQFSVDSKGRLTAAGSSVITPDWSNVQHTPDTLAGYGITDALPADATAVAASKLADSHTLTATGDASWHVAFDGSTDVVAPLTLANTGVAAGTYPKVTVDSKGRVTAGAKLAAEDIPALDWSKINSGKPTTLAGYGITDALPATATAMAANKLASSHTLTATGDASWNVAFDGSADVAAPLTLANSGVTAGSYGSATTAAQVTVDGKGRVTAAQSTPITPAWNSVTGKPTTLAGYGITDALPANSTAMAANKLASSHTLTATGDASWGVAFDGSADVAAPLTLANTGVAAGTYPKVAVDAKGRVIAGSTLAAADIPALDWSKITTGKPMTRAGYGITDAAPIDSPTLTGTPTVPTPAQFDSSAKLASTAFVQRALGNSSDVARILNSTSTQLTAMDAGKMFLIYLSQFGTVTLPPGATLPRGAVIEIFVQLVGEGVQISGAGNDFIVYGVQDGPAITLQSGNYMRFVWQGNVWLAAGSLSPVLSGIPTAPTAAAGTNTQQLATMAALQTGLYSGKGVKRFTDNGTFTVPAGVTTLYISGCGGGGGGGGSGCGSGNILSSGSGWMAGGGGGGAGQSIMRQPYAVTPGQVLSIAIGGAGAGGVGGPADDNGSVGVDGTAGGATTVAELGLRLSGGDGGTGSSTNAWWGGNCGPGNGGWGYPAGTVGWSGPTSIVCYPGGIGGSSPFGGGGGTRWWGWGGDTSISGVGYGSGGGGAMGQRPDATGNFGANGAPGLIMIEW